MDEEEIKNSIIERYNSLQPEVQAAIMDSNYEKHIYDIAQKYKLTVEQMGEFEADTTLVMLGQIHPDDYNETLVDSLKLPVDKVNEIVTDVNALVLSPIRDILKKNFEEDDRIETDFTNTPPPPYTNIEIKKTDEPKKIETITPPSTYSSNFIVNIKKEEKVPEPIIPISPIIQTTKEDEVPIPPKIDMANIQKNIIEEKLKGATVSEHTISTHTEPGLDIPLSTIAKADIQTASKNPHDPYREII